MKKLLLVGISVVSFAAGAAQAADLPTNEPSAFQPSGLVNWQGAYAGVFGGGAFGSTKSRFDAQTVDVDPSGVALGGLVGFNTQWNALVLGLEGDLGWSGARGAANYVSLTSGLAESEKISSSYAGRARLRMGYAFGQFLPFIAGGVTFMDDDMRLFHTTTGQVPFSLREDQTGGNIGVGVDYAFDAHWFARVEYINDFFGKRTYGFGALTAGQFDDRALSSNQGTVRAAIAYKF